MVQWSRHLGQRPKKTSEADLLAAVQDDLEFLRKYVDPVFYFEKYPDVATAGQEAVVHYCLYGWKEMRDPCAFFSTKDYVTNSESYVPELGNPFTHYLKELERGNIKKVARSQDDWQRFAFTGSFLDAVGDHADKSIFVRIPPARKDDIELISQNMDIEFYLDEYPDVKDSGMDPAAHYLFFGWLKGYDPSPAFSSRYYLENNKDVRLAGSNPYLHFLRHGRNEKWRKRADRISADVLQRFEQNPLLQYAVDHAINLDPMVALPSTGRVVTGPPLSSESSRVAKQLRQRFEGRSFEHIVLLPHVRMSGASKIGGHFAHAAADVVGAENTLVVLCDLPILEHPEWFPENVEILNFAELVGDMKNGPEKGALLYDLFRGVNAKSITNVNSGVAWALFRNFGRQLSQDFSMNCYLFCWEETKQGARVGYPIQWLHDTVNCFSKIVCDSAFLAEHVMDRFALTEDVVVPALTPIDPTSIKYSSDQDVSLNSKSQRSKKTANASGKKLLWAGRFDRQKRMDVLLAIAERNPQWEFIVYGKPVLEDKETEEIVTALSAMNNVEIMGAYQHVGDVLQHQPDLFLYTSQYDGIPTVLLEIGELELPIVAPDVGGVNEVINSNTGWLIGVCDDVDAYEAAIRDALKNREAATQKAKNFKKLLRSEHSLETYLNTLKTVLKPE